MKNIITLLLIASIAKGQRMNDDSKHFYAGLGISVGVSALLYDLTDNNKLSISIGFVSGVGAGVLKEYWWDKHLQRGTFSKEDLYTTMWGSLTSIPILISIRDFKKRKEINIDTNKYYNLNEK
ncbi:MAG: hypothetical protein EKK61_04055 [Rickettsiales bacterium]|nr:MAG: hypothetical protein EKK61_04055 [Rickettsiales bacterium]